MENARVLMMEYDDDYDDQVISSSSFELNVDILCHSMMMLRRQVCVLMVMINLERPKILLTHRRRRSPRETLSQ